MEKLTKSEQFHLRAKFSEYASVVIDKNPRKSRWIKSDPDWKALKNGDRGAVMEVYHGRDEIAYEVDFPGKKILACIPERYLRSADTEQQGGTSTKSSPPKPPAMPEALAQQEDEGPKKA